MLGEQIEPVDRETGSVADLAQQIDVALRLLAEREVLPHDDFRDVQALYQDLVDIAFGRQPHEFRGEGHHAEDVDTQFLGKLGSPREGGQLCRVRTWPDDLHRMRIERHQHARNAPLGRRVHRPTYESGVPAVHAVENADRENTTAPVGRYVVETSPSLHEAKPTAHRRRGHFRIDVSRQTPVDKPANSLPRFRGA